MRSGSKISSRNTSGSSGVSGFGASPTAESSAADTPIAAFISENLADVYQDTGNFISLFRQGNEEVMLGAIVLCRKNFSEFWGQQLLNALKALHAVRYSDEEFLETNEEE